MNTQDKTTRNQKLRELAERFVNSKMNSERRNNPSIIIRQLGKSLNDIQALRNHFVEQKARLDKEGKYEFERYFDKDIIQTFDELVDAVKAGKPSAPVEEVVSGFIIEALHSGHLFHGFKWKNLDALIEADLFNLMYEFDSDFRGDIVTCHNVGGKYIVIETERHPFDYDKQRNKTHEPKEKQFYSTELRGKGAAKKLYLTSTVFNSFEDALFHTMAPSQYSAMSILFTAANKED